MLTCELGDLQQTAFDTGYKSAFGNTGDRDSVAPVT